MWLGYIQKKSSKEKKRGKNRVVTSARIIKSISIRDWANSSREEGYSDSMESACLSLDPIPCQIHSNACVFIFPPKNDGIDENQIGTFLKGRVRH